MTAKRSVRIRSSAWQHGRWAALLVSACILLLKYGPKTYWRINMLTDIDGESDKSSRGRVLTEDIIDDDRAERTRVIAGEAPQD